MSLTVVQEMPSDTMLVSDGGPERFEGQPYLGYIVVLGSIFPLVSNTATDREQDVVVQSPEH